MEFKEKILFARAKLNLSQMDLAKELGVAFQTINRWELGKVSLTKKADYAFELYCKEKNIKFEAEDNN